jgi:hypothetical protein
MSLLAQYLADKNPRPRGRDGAVGFHVVLALAALLGAVAARLP